MTGDNNTSPSYIRRRFGIRKSTFIAIFFAIAALIWILSGVLTNEEPPKADEIASPAEKGSETAQQKTSVRVADVSVQNMLHTVKINGLTQASRTVNLTSEISGKVNSIHKEEGSIVNENEEIIGITTEDRSSLVRRAEKTVEQRRIELEAAQELHKKDFVSDVRLAEARAALEEAEAEMERAHVNLGNTVISAPFKGIVDTVHVEIGDVVSPGTQMATLLDLMPAEFVVYVSEKNVRNIKPGIEAKAFLVDGTELDLTVSYVAAQADPETRTFLVKLTYTNEKMDVVAGMTTRVVLPVGEEKAHYIPPSILTLNEDGQVGVKAVDESSTVVFYPIEILQSTQKGIWIKGLPDEVTLVVVGQEFVASGETVETQKTDQAFLPISDKGGE